MGSQNLLIGALSYMIEFQETHCGTARERAYIAFEALSESNDSNPELRELCFKASELLAR
jgi:hypothetical protein